MAAVTTFDSTKESLLDMLRNIQEGKSQLPDFQRGWVGITTISSVFLPVSLNHILSGL